MKSITAQNSLTTKIFHINHDSNIPKYRQLVKNINAAISQNLLNYGDVLPSVNQLCEEASLSRDTVFKSYQLLKSQGVIDSVPNKGYYVAKEIRRVFLLLDTFKAYKEVMYHTFTSSLPDNYIVDVQFHNYNAAIFQKLVEDSVGQYSNYVIMPFNDDKVKLSLSKIPNDNLLIIDWNTFDTNTNNVIFQDFGKAFEISLTEALPHLKKYNTLNLVYPFYTNHPKATRDYFNSFCNEHNFESTTITGKNNFELQKNALYICVSERSLGYILSECNSKNIVIGEELGLISYNETPMKKFIQNGISVISTDFELMGKRAAEFVLGEENIQQIIPTKFIKRQSI